MFQDVKYLYRGHMDPTPHRAPPDALTLEVVELIGDVVVRFHSDYERAAAEQELTGAQARLLGLLALEPTPMRKLARRLRCEPSNVTGIVDRLEARGLAERRPDPADRRVKVAAATEEGLRAARRLRESLRFAHEPLAGLSDGERARLRTLLRRVLEAGEETGAERAARAAVLPAPESEPGGSDSGAGSPG